MSDQRENTLMLKLETVIPEWSQLSSVDTAEGLSAIVVVTLLALFGASLLFALREFWLSNSRVSELQNLLSNADRETLAERRRELRHAAESETKSGKLWREFDESLVLVESQSRLFNTIDAAHFLTPTLSRED